MGITLTQSSEQKYSGDFSGKIVFSNYTSSDKAWVHFASYEQIIEDDIYKIIVEESVSYKFSLYLYPENVDDVTFNLLVKWYFDDNTYEEGTYKPSLTVDQWNLSQHDFTAPYYEDKNVQCVKTFLEILPSSSGSDIVIYIDNVKFYPVIVDQTTLIEDGMYWVSILKGFQFINRTEGYRTIGYPGTSAPLYGFDIRYGGCL